jgi:hypothetical protein
MTTETIVTCAHDPTLFLLKPFSPKDSLHMSFGCHRGMGPITLLYDFLILIFILVTLAWNRVTSLGILTVR